MLVTDQGGCSEAKAVRTSFWSVVFAFLFKTVGREEVGEMNGPPTLLQFEFSSLTSDQMQNHLGRPCLPSFPFFIQMLFYSYKVSSVTFASEQRFLIPRSSQLELRKVLRADGEGNHPLPLLQTLTYFSVHSKTLSFLFLKVFRPLCKSLLQVNPPFPWSQDNMRLGLIWKATWTQIWEGKVQAHPCDFHSKGSKYGCWIHSTYKHYLFIVYLTWS